MYSSRTLTNWEPWATVFTSLALTWKDSTTEDRGRMYTSSPTPTDIPSMMAKVKGSRTETLVP